MGWIRGLQSFIVELATAGAGGSELVDGHGLGRPVSAAPKVRVHALIHIKAWNLPPRPSTIRAALLCKARIPPLTIKTFFLFFCCFSAAGLRRGVSGELGNWGIGEYYAGFISLASAVGEGHSQNKREADEVGFELHFGWSGFPNCKRIISNREEACCL